MREETATARAPCAAAWAATAAGTSSEPSSTLATNSTGLAVSEPRSRGGVRAPRRAAGTLRTGRPACSAVDHLAQPRLLGDRRAVAAAGLFGDPLDAPLGLLEVGERELGLDRLDVAQRVDAALGVHDALVGVGAHDVHDRVGLADVRQEAVAEALALRARRRPARRCRGSRSCPSTISEAPTVARDLAPGARRAPAPRRRWARSS